MASSSRPSTANALDLQILEDGANVAGLKTPPRQPKLTDTFAYIGNPDEFCRLNLERYGPVFKTSVFGGTTVFVGASREIQMAFNGDGNYSEIGLPPTTMDMFGEYSLFQRPDLHRQRKSSLRPGFTGQMLAGYLPHMHRVMAQHLDHWPTQQPLPLVPTVEALSFDILAPLLLGIKLEEGDRAFEGLPVGSKAELKALYKTFFDGFYGLVKWRSPLTTFGRGQNARGQLIQFMRAIIQKRRDSVQNSGQAIDPSGDFLAMMLASQHDDPDSVFSDRLIENQCLLQLWASHYEVMGLMSSWMYQIGQHPEVLAQVRAEQAQVLGSDQASLKASLDSVGLDQLKAMPYLDATIKETLRLAPPSSTATRRLTRSIVLDGVLYEKGWGIIAEPRIAHRMSEYFTRPDQFEPERFLPERGEGKMNQFIPFGGGVHACLGAQMAMTMGKLFAVHVLPRFDWELLGEAQFVQFPLRQIKNDYQIQLSQRLSLARGN